MRDLLEAYDRLAALGPVGRAVVTQVWGSAPRREGATLLALADGTMAGSVSGGCVEAAVVEAIGSALRTGAPRLLRFEVADERAWEVGLSCGGVIHVFVEPEVRPEVLDAARAGGDRVVPSVIDGPIPLGAPPPDLRAALAPELAAALAARSCRAVRASSPAGEVTVFLEVFERQPTLLLIGAVHVAEALTSLARRLGYRVLVADAREALLSADRFPEAHRLIRGWPAEAFAEAGVDDSTYICVLTHDPKFDDPAVELALRSKARYIGAIGSRKTHAARRARLRAQGFSDADLDRIRGPAGLDLGGRQPAEIALAILAEVTAARYGRLAGGHMGVSAEGP